ncbi:MAG: MFS transporter [Clostridia bacterium]|nr:MFS transporter [Clostridia bacterium]
MKRNKDKLGLFTKLSYGVGNLGYGALGQTISSFIMFFGTSIMGISGSLVGVTIALASLWDGASDPLVGHLSDHTKSKFFGRRLGHMLFATFGLAICNILIWHYPNTNNEFLLALWLWGFLILIETFNTFFATPYSALAIDIAPDYNEQSNLQGFKSVFYIIGMILPGLLMYYFSSSVSLGMQTQFSKESYISIAYVNSVLVLVCGLICVFGCMRRVHKQNTKKIIEEKKEKKKFLKLIIGYFETLKKPNFSAIMLGYSAAQISTAFLTSVGMHLFTYCYHFSSSQISLLMMCLFGGAILSQLLWVYIVKLVDKKQALVFSLFIILLGISFISITFIFRLYVPTNVMFYFVAPCFLLCGIGSGAIYSLPVSMYADVVTLEQFNTGENHAGTYSGYYTFTYNFSNSITLLFIGILLDFIKFDSTEPVQALSVQSGLGLIVFLGCSIALTVSILMFSKYKVKRSDVLKAQLKLKEKYQNEDDV